MIQQRDLESQVKMNELCQGIFNILSSEISSITATVILKEKTKQIGKTPETLEKSDLQKLFPLLISAVAFFSGEKKADVIKRKLEETLT